MPAAVLAKAPSAPAIGGEPGAPVNQIPGKRKTLLAILAVMVCMAALAAVFAYFTVQDRRRNDYRTQKKSPFDVHSAAAAETSLLGYLPAGCNVLAAVDGAAMMKQAAVRGLLENMPWDLAAHWERWTGLKLDEVEQIVAGAQIHDKLPQIFIVAQTRRPYDPEKIAAFRGSASATMHLGKRLVRRPLQPTGEALVWCHSERLLVLVVCLDAAKLEDLEAIPKTPRRGTEGFAAPLIRALEERLPSSSVLWLAGHFDQPSPVQDLAALVGGKNAALDAILRTKTFVVSIQPEQPLTLTAHFFMGDAKAARETEKLLEQERWPEAASYKVAGPPPESNDAGASWVTLQVRGDLSGWPAFRRK